MLANEKSENDRVLENFSEFSENSAREETAGSAGRLYGKSCGHGLCVFMQISSYVERASSI